jgi:hypothetical protein
LTAAAEISHFRNMKKRPGQIHSDFEAHLFSFPTINDSTKIEMLKLKPQPMELN